MKCADLVDLMIFYLEDISNTETEKQRPRGLLNEQIPPPKNIMAELIASTGALWSKATRSLSVF